MQKVKSIKERKLGKHKALGLAYTENGEIHIDERLKGEEYLYVLIHEILHIQNPKWPEIKIIGHAKELANIIYSKNFRKVCQ